MEIFNKFKNNIYSLINKDNIESIKSIIEPEIVDTKILNCIIYPIYYFFDEHFNPEIGSTIKVRNKLRELYQLDKIFNLKDDSIINIPSIVHSTILCKFELNNKKYLYYSNSGLGIHNNLRFNIENNQFVAPKIFEVKDDSMYDLIPKYIEFILSKIINLDEKCFVHIHSAAKFDTDLINPYDSYIKENITKYPFLGNIKIDVSDFEEIVKNIVNSGSKKGENLINLCYSLLYFISSRLKENFIECMFINLISTEEYDTSFLLNKYLIVNNDNLKEFYNNSFEKNKIISTEIANNIQTYTINDDKINSFNFFIDKINKKLEDISTTSESVKFKLNQLKVCFNNFVILNLEQKSGSCAFYSYYYLKNIMLLKIYNEKILNIEEKADSYINKILEFHYKMIHLYGVSQDTSLIDNIYNADDYFNYNFINNLCDSNNLTDEFIKIYDKDTFILNNKNKPRIDYLLDFNIYGKYSYNFYENSLIDYSFYIDIVNFMKEKINLIRSKTTEINPLLLKNEFDKFFSSTYSLIYKPDLIMADEWDAMKNLYYVYLLILPFL